jgi:hypothetical protein
MELKNQAAGQRRDEYGYKVESEKESSGRIPHIAQGRDILPTASL